MNALDEAAAAQGLERHRTVPVQPQASPLYRRDRVPESYQFQVAPQVGNMTNNSGPIGTPSPWRIVTVGQTFTLQDPYVNMVQLGTCLYTTFGTSGDGTTNGQVLSTPVMLQCFGKQNQQQEFQLFATLPLVGSAVVIPVFTTIYSFRAYVYGTQLPWIGFPANSSSWSADGTLIATFS